MEKFMDRVIDAICSRCSGESYKNPKIFTRGKYNREDNPNILILKNKPLNGDIFYNICNAFDIFMGLDGNIDSDTLIRVIMGGEYKSIHKDEHFHNYVKPPLLYFYTNRNEIFLRHGLEQIDKLECGDIFPPINSFRNVVGEDSYPIEIDRVPFGYNRIDKVDQCGFCSNHDWYKEWNIVKGFITLKDFDALGGKIINSEKRDHLYAKSKIHLSKWYFLYQCTDESDQRILYLKKNGVNVIEQRVLTKFFKMVKILCDKMEVLNLVKI